MCTGMKPVAGKYKLGWYDLSRREDEILDKRLRNQTYSIRQRDVESATLVEDGFGKAS